MNLNHLIQSLPNYTIPKHYGWDATCGVSLEDFGFTVMDCLHKKKVKTVEVFPDDFDLDLYDSGNVVKKVKTFVEINPAYFIMAQRYVDKHHLLDLTVNHNPKPARMIQCGKHYIVQDGHHRLTLKYLKGHKVYATVSILG